jgi:Lanthionine-containing peptide SapB precursor RamS
MALLDLQGMELSATAERGGGSRLSVTGCPGKSSLSITVCD